MRGLSHPPYYTDNLMHNLRTERFFTSRTINGRTAAMEFFNLVLGVRLSEQEKKDLVAFLRLL
jgi:hypothetical protein